MSALFLALARAHQEILTEFLADAERVDHLAILPIRRAQQKDEIGNDNDDGQR